MRTVKVRAVVNARANQGRVILHLECHHNISRDAGLYYGVPPLDVNGNSPMDLIDTLIDCPFCADPAPPTPLEVLRGKTSQQLWKEAGQP